VPFHRIDIATIHEVDPRPSGFGLFKAMDLATKGIGEQLRTEANAERGRCIRMPLAQPATFALQPFGSAIDRMRSTQQDAPAMQRLRQFAEVGAMDLKAYAIPAGPRTEFADSLGRMVLQDNQSIAHGVPAMASDRATPITSLLPE